MKKILLLCCLSASVSANAMTDSELIDLQANELRKLRQQVEQLQKKVDETTQTIIERCTRSKRRGLIHVKKDDQLYIIECEQNPGI